MNQIYSEPAGKELIVLLIGITGYLIGYLIYRNGKPKNEWPVTVHSIIQEARDWYDKMYPGASDHNLPGQNIGKLYADWNKKFKPNWLKAQLFNEGGATMIEMPVLKNGEMTMSFFRDGTTEYDFNKSGTITSLLIAGRQGDFSVYAMTIIASPSYLSANPGELRNNTYQKKDKDFDGVVFFNKMDGTFLNGWHFQKGKATGQLYQLNVNCSGILAGERCKSINESLPGAGSLIAVTLWEDHIYAGNDPTIYNCNTYITTNVYAECPVGEGITKPGGIKETLNTQRRQHSLPSRLRLDQELHQLKTGVRVLN
jgi:hypothetical protein